MTDALLAVKNLSIAYRKHGKSYRVVDNVSFSLAPGEALGLVGESGCGKSTTALGLLRLLPKNARIESGQALFQGKDLLSIGNADLRRIRGHKIACIFQDPMSSLNPYMRIIDQLREPLRLHIGMDKEAASKEALRLAEQVSLPDSAHSIRKYPHELSGGQRQRVMIAMALACKPDLLIADEPSTALDVTVQKQILELIRTLQRKLGMAMLLITHDLAVVNETCDRLAVLYAGRIAEIGACKDVLHKPLHPYTQNLLQAVPRPHMADDEALAVIEGLPPAIGQIPTHCAFADRCPQVSDQCRAAPVPLQRITETQNVACVLQQGEAEGTA